MVLDCGCWETLSAGVDAIDDLLSGVYGVEIRKALNPLKLSDHEKIVMALAKELKGHVIPVERAALKKAMATLDVDWAKLSPAARIKVIEAGQKYLGDPVASAAMPKIEQTLAFNAKDIVAGTKKNSVLTYDLKVSPNMEATDDRIVDFMKKSQGHFIRDEFGQRRDDFGAKAKAIVASGLERGLGSADIAQRLNDTIGLDAGRGQGYWDVIAMVFANRARTMTQLASFHESGIEEYIWESVLDRATSVQCRFMHGRKFQVHAAMKKFQDVEDADSPEAIKQIQPFMQFGSIDGKEALYHGSGDSKQLVAHVTDNASGKADDVGKYANALDNEQLMKLGIHAPPLHGRCRSTIIPEFASAGTPAAPGFAPPPPSAAPPKLTPGAAKAKALQTLAGLSEEFGKGTAPNDDLFAAGADPDPAFLEHPAMANANDGSIAQIWQANAVSKKPKLDEIIATEPCVDKDLVAKYIQNAKALDSAPIPKVVSYQGKLYAIDGHEQLAAQKLMGQNRAYCQIVDLDKALKQPTAPLTSPVHPPAMPAGASHPAPAPAPVAPPKPAAAAPQSKPSAKEAAKSKLDAISAGDSANIGSLFTVKSSPPFSGKIQEMDALVASKGQKKTIDPSSVIASTSHQSKSKIENLIYNESALAEAIKKAKVIEVDGKLYIFGGHDAFTAAKLLGKDGIEATYVDATKTLAAPAAPPPPPPAPAPAAPATGGTLAHLPTKKLPDADVRAPEGYRALASERISKASQDSRDAISAFTGSAYTDIRKYERGLEPHNTNAKRYAEHIDKAFDAVPPTPGTVYRGIRGLTDAQLKAFAESKTIEMGATSSTSRSPRVAFSFGSTESRYGGNRVLFVLKQRSAIAVETISRFKSENELLLHKDSKFKVTGTYRAEHSPDVLIIEAEETTDARYKGPAEEPPPRRRRSRSA